MGACRYCNGRGWDSVEGGRYFRCPDCGGSGYLEECDCCGAEFDGEFCEKCYAECKECGAVTLKEDLTNNLCEECAEEFEQQQKEQK